MPASASDTGARK